MKDVIKFLKLNGFKKIETNSYANDRCNVVLEKDSYAVANNSGDAMYSKDLNIYWLIGVLTYYNYMDKNYTT
jgi:hypothetical protein